MTTAREPARPVAVPPGATRPIHRRSAAVTPAEARQRRALRDGRVLDALRLGGSAAAVAAAVGISAALVRRIAFEARKNGQPDAVPPRRPYRRAG